ncbi:hypothetical protein DL96DRAFT_1553475 [Flagelloscypha sp. PMI_526]|nr:hypothetical protein DL96DRAFT_1553475 [Flagelloscypha sp. PMI_526]
MFSSVAALLVAAVYVSAAPMDRLAIRQGSCDIASCGAALAPTGVSCVGAAVKLGKDPLSDAGCVTSVTNLGVNTPAVCQSCFSEVGDLIPQPVKDVADEAGSAVSGAFDDVKDGISGLFGRDTCDIAACGVAVAPTGVSCVSAAVEEGVNPLADAGCVTSVTNLGVNTPDVCKPCFGTIGSAVAGAAETAGDAIKGAAEDAGSAISGAFSSLFGREE